MDITLDQALDNSDKHQDSLEDDGSNDLMQEVHVGDGLSHEEQQQLAGDVSGQQSGLQTYQFRSGDNSQVTYRVVQVGGSDENQQATLSIVSTNGIQNILTPGATGTPQVAIVTNPFNETGESSSSNTVSDTQGAKFAYFPSSGGASSSQELSSQGDSAEQQGVAQGQFYVMMSPQDMLQTTQSSKHPLAPRSQFVQKMDPTRGGVVVRDTTRRVQHNEVERRRRDKINNWIMKLSKLVPDCQGDHSKQGQSKGGILAKTCEYISELQQLNQQYEDSLKEMERMQLDHEMIRIQLEEKKQENLILHQTLRNHGLQVDIKSVSSTAQ
ncbi:upstream stimulatory factor 2-like [Clavelina lepadiformis]|uniref:BHLH domain-containing protein n=1 Tax=Clavelina lepadiformis TaxID=159417 RepID=A0ABP0GMS4_CLALP